MKPLRVLALMHESLVPPDSLKGLTEKEIDEFRTEYDVKAALEKAGHEVKALGLRDNLLELQVRDVLSQELPMEQDLTRWLAVWDAPGL